MAKALRHLQFPELISRSWETPDDILLDNAAFRAMQQRETTTRKAYHPNLKVRDSLTFGKSPKGNEPYESRDRLSLRVRYDEALVQWLYGPSDEPEKNEGEAEGESGREKEKRKERDLLLWYLAVTGYKRKESLNLKKGELK